MPRSAEHRSKYQANRAHLDTGNGGLPLASADGCWAATVAFYAALHLVDRLASVAGVHPANHAERLRFVGARHRTIYGEFNDLKYASEMARYGTLNQFARQYPGDVVQSMLIEVCLATIERYVDGFFTPPASPPVVGTSP